MTEIEKSRQFQKQDYEKQIVYGVVYAPNRGDADDEYMSAEEIEKMAHRFMLVSRKIDTQHSGVRSDVFPVESFIARKGDPDFPEGAWVLGVKILEPELWEKVKSGQLNSFSFAGVAEYGEAKEVDSAWYDDNGERVNPFEVKNETKNDEEGA